MICERMAAGDKRPFVMDYNGKRWQQKRKHILIRDGWTDQYLKRQGIKTEAKLVHHILPVETYPEHQWQDWNLISVSVSTHRHLHDKYTGALSPDGWELARETAEAQGIKLTTVTLVIGLPGSGKSTWTRQHLGGGLVYELDAIASAFRLTVPHTEQPHGGARRMAAALRSGWLAAAPKYASHLFIVRTAPDYEELSEIMPDKIVVCTKQYVKRPYKYDIAEYRQKVSDVIAWAEANDIEIQYFPGKSGE